MSTAKEAIINEDTFLQHASLKNYKSIKDVEIDFKPGLNIIIGKNGSGKTNFLNCLNNIFKFKYNQQPDTESKISIDFKNEKVDLEAFLSSDDTLIKGNRFPLIYRNIKLIISGVIFEGGDPDSVQNELFDDGYFFDTRIINHGNPYKNSLFVENPITLTLFNNATISKEIFIRTDIESQFIEQYFLNLYFFLAKNYREKLNNNISLIQLKNDILDFSENVFGQLNYHLKNYSPIEQVRLNPEFKIIEEDGKRISLANFYIDFKIIDKWLPYQFLSDGTKRLFYIISEFIRIELEKLAPEEYELKTLLIEEPELGIHPHQLHQLMQFIKEQSKEKQIILTTHSPQVLDILEPDELDRIIICHYDSEKGTQLNHLTDQQIKKAKKYMSSEAFLSDYWRFSDLEPA